MVKKVSQGIYTFCLSVCVVILIIITTLALMQVCGRYIFHHTFFWVEEITTMLIGWIVALGTPALWLKNEHIAMDALLAFLPKKAIRIWDMVIQVFAMGTGGVLFAAGMKALRLNSGYSISMLRYDESVKFIFVPVLGALLTVCAALVFVQLIMSGKCSSDMENGGEADGT